MVMIRYIEPDSACHDVDIDAGYSLMQGALKAGLRRIVADCGGAGACATCHMYIDPLWLGHIQSPDEMEIAMLDYTYNPYPNSRLTGWFYCNHARPAALLNGTHALESPSAVPTPIAISYPTPTVAWRTVAILFFPYILPLSDRYIMALLVEPIKADLQATDFQISLLQGAAFALLYAIFALPMRVALDRFDRRRVLHFSVTEWSIATAACGLVELCRRSSYCAGALPHACNYRRWRALGLIRIAILSSESPFRPIASPSPCPSS